MKCFYELPEGFEQMLSIDLQKDKKLMILVNALALIISIVMVIPALFLVPIKNLFSFDKGMGMYAIRFAVLFAGIIVYMILHELVHGITMKMAGTKKVKYGFTGMYAFAGSDDYYDKKSYIIIALAPVAVWGIVLLILNFLVPTEWFWVVYLIQVMNISGAAGDFYVTWRFCKLKDIIVKDHGTGMQVFGRSENI